jgi:hypothetical protein
MIGLRRRLVLEPQGCCSCSRAQAQQESEQLLLYRKDAQALVPRAHPKKDESKQNGSFAITVAVCSVRQYARAAAWLETCYHLSEVHVSKHAGRVLRQLRESRVLGISV